MAIDTLIVVLLLEDLRFALSFCPPLAADLELLSGAYGKNSATQN